MKRMLLTAIAMLTAVALDIVGGTGAQARSIVPPIPSPWSGGMSAADQAASAANRPAFADANWNHEVCAIAYSYEGVPQEIARRRSGLRPMHKENAAQTEERRRLDALEREAAEHLRNIPKCKGQFYRPALEATCNTLGEENRFCAQLSGVTLSGVELVEDEMGFAHGLAWNKLGNLFSQGVAFAPSPLRPGLCRITDASIWRVRPQAELPTLPQPIMR